MLRALTNKSLTTYLTKSLSTSNYVQPEEMNKRWEMYFRDPTLDGWQLRKGMNQLQSSDVIPEPVIVKSILDACRRLNEYSLTTRYLEALKYKCVNSDKRIYPWMLQEIQEKLDELGISTPDELGFGEPEFFDPQ